MAQISKKPISKELERKIYAGLIEAVKLLKNEKEIDKFLGDLLTPTEQVMISKRLAIAILLSNGKKFEEICSLLNVTPSTVNWISKTYQLSEGFRLAIDRLKKSESNRALWQDLESLLYRLSSPARGFMEEGAIRSKLGHKKKTLA